MNCPYCGEDMTRGFVEVRESLDIFNLGIGTTMSWMPDDERKKIVRKNAVNLNTKGEGYYCEKCRKAVALLEERGDEFLQ